MTNKETNQDEQLKIPAVKVLVSTEAAEEDVSLQCYLGENSQKKEEVSIHEQIKADKKALR